MKELLLVALFTVFFQQLKTQDTSWKYNIHPFSKLGNNTAASFWGYNSLFHIGGIAATYLIVESGIDKNVHNYFSQNRDIFNASSLPAVYIGYTAPVLLGASLYGFGWYKNNPKAAAAGCAVLQATLIAFAEQSVLKAFTGRPNPDNFVYTNATDQSSSFRFGFMQGGIHYGWPSGHMLVTTAVVSSLTNFYFDSKIIKYSAWASWAYMLYGVVSHEGNTMHWTSDVVAGSLMGYSIGSSVGKGFRELYESTGKSNLNSLKLKPILNKDKIGLSVYYTF